MQVLITLKVKVKNKNKRREGEKMSLSHNKGPEQGIDATMRRNRCKGQTREEGNK